MNTLRTAAQQALEAMDELYRSLKDAGFRQRDNRLYCDECGKKFTRQMLPIHKCEPAMQQTLADEPYVSGLGKD